MFSTERITLRNKEGITLIELLITTTLISLISFAIYLSISNGAKVWKRVRMETELEELYIIFHKFRTDLKNTFYFRDIPFSGESERIEFPTLVYSPHLKKRTVGKVVYFYDKNNKSLNREEFDFSEIYCGQKSSSLQTLKNIVSLSFQYYFYDRDKKGYFWKDEWEGQDFPLAVRWELEFSDGENKKFTQTVDIPIMQ